MKKHIDTFEEFSKKRINESDSSTEPKIDIFTLISELEKMAYAMEDYVEKALPYKGDVCEDSQKVCLLNAIGELQNNINGLEESDLIDDDELEY